MHNLTKIRVYRICLYISYPLALVLVYPLVLFRKRKPGVTLFFMFDRYAIGGAQKIYLDVLKSVEDLPKEIYFTRSSFDAKLKESFFSIPNSRIKDIHHWCENLFIRLFSIHYYAFYLNRQPKVHLFSSNSTFFYDLLPFLSKRVTTTELFHNFAHHKNGMEFFGLANHQYLTHRFIYDTYTLNNITQQYQQYGVDAVFLQKIRFIEPGVSIPLLPEKDFSLPLRILYAGRGGAQKRVWILNKIIEQLSAKKRPVEFFFAGTMQDDLNEYTKSVSTLYGPLSTEAEMYAAYSKAHVLILTSLYEGFPMVIKESMACGCIPLVTALEGNKMHLINNDNALLINSVTDEEAVVREAVEHIEYLLENEPARHTLSENAYNYAKKHFNRELFYAECRKLLYN